ncbi:MAG: hypothetical protein HN742_25590 [Lentisphaerae bacterium]|jgi:hypothetical protein|nr:hypothetical protein [Lentisphaerota bacterium]MBT4820005.1 hypothetical protein [Lentisphaerota bacterium]MBT5612295.1 hypothetical protein [Lentisphaerota bacterium]MBT7060727.1 hypothetical protein [Lentisphaerota bacterium]MBT7845274.1 hypothetical protein [Lentisphaerota bacterium]
MDVKLERTDPFSNRVLACEARGGDACEAMVVVPTITRPGEPFTVGVSILDRFRLPSFEGADDVRLSAGDEDKDGMALSFSADQPAIVRVHGIVLEREGLHRLACRLNGQTFHSNPTLCTADSRRRQILWGDPHIHTILSDCHPDRCRSLNLACIASRDAYFLDWVTLADHVSNGRSSKGKWKAMWTAVDLFDDPGGFVMLPGYEASLQGWSGGDNNVYLLNDLPAYVDEYDSGNTLTLAKELGERLPQGAFFIVPHHTSRPGKHGAIPREIYPGADVMPVVEIHSKWGTSEFRGNPTPLKHGVADAPSFVRDLLAQGYHLGFVGGTDTHTTLTFARGIESPHIDRLPGLTAVQTNEFSRRGIFRGIQRRQCYAACGERMLIDVRISGARMGSERTVSLEAARRARTVRAQVAGITDLESVEIIRNGQVVHSATPEGWKTELNWRDTTPLDEVALTADDGAARFAYYYVRATTVGGGKVWSSPTRFVLACEPGRVVRPRVGLHAF